MNFFLSALVFALSIFSPAILTDQVSAQTVSAPLDALSSSIYGESVYVYNPASQTIVSPATSDHGLVLVPVQNYDSSMQWTLSSGLGSSVTISAVSSTAANCDASSTARWNAPKVSPTVTVCSPSTSVYQYFIFFPTSQTNTYNIMPYFNYIACLVDVSNVLTSPSGACDRSGSEAQWQLVTIS